MRGVESVEVGIVRLAHSEGLQLPDYASAAAAGADLLAAIDQDIELAPLERRIVPAGISISLPPGFEAQVRPRSGLAAKHGVTVANAPGTIDADYRGEIGVILINLGREPFRITRGMRIAQLVVARHVRAVWREVTELDRPGLPEGQLYLHVDLDVIDSAVVPGLRYPAPGGPGSAEVADALRRVLGTDRVAAVGLACTWHPGHDAAARVAPYLEAALTGS